MSRAHLPHHPLMQEDSPYGSPSHSPRQSPGPMDLDISDFRSPPETSFSLLEVPPTNWTAGSGTGGSGTGSRETLYRQKKVRRKFMLFVLIGSSHTQVDNTITLVYLLMRVAITSANIYQLP